jgi:hypothetical protein
MIMDLKKASHIGSWLPKLEATVQEMPPKFGVELQIFLRCWRLANPPGGHFRGYASKVSGCAADIALNIRGTGCD